MRILHTVEYYYPSAGGAQEVIRQISERMVKMGHDVTVATTRLAERKNKNINGVKITEFTVKGNDVVGISGQSKKYQGFLTSGSFDIMLNYAAQQWATDLAYPILDEVKAKKILVPCGYSALNNPDFTKYFNKMPEVLKKYDATVYLSNSYQDIMFSRKHGIKNLHVIPNAADENEFSDLKPSYDFRKKFSINGFFVLTIGNHTGSKGHAETLKVFKSLPFDSTLVMVGADHPGGCYSECFMAAEKINSSHSKRYKKVILLKPNREKIELPAFKSADVFLFLSNVEASPLVLFEAAAAGLPFLASEAGNSSEIAKWTKGGLTARSRPDNRRRGNIIPSVNDSLIKMIRLRGSPRLRRRLSESGRRNWEAKFTWQKITEQYIGLYEELLR